MINKSILRQCSSSRKLKMIFLILLSSLILTFAIVTFTVQGSTKINEKYYKSIIINSGDSLWSIAEEYYDKDNSSISSYIEELKSINNISNENIKSGNYLVVSYYID